MNPSTTNKMDILTTAAYFIEDKHRNTTNAVPARVIPNPVVPIPAKVLHRPIPRKPTPPVTKPEPEPKRYTIVPCYLPGPPRVLYYKLVPFANTTW